LSHDGEKLEEEVGAEVMSNFIRLIEILIMLEEYIKCRRFERKHLIRFKDFSRTILDQFKRTYDRKHGTKFNVNKLHLLLHFADEILNNGPALGFDSGCGEHGHIQRKKAAKNTQRRQDKFHYQAGTRTVENIAIDFAFNNLHHVKREHVFSEKKDGNQASGNSYFASRKGIFIQRNNPPFIEAKWSSDKCLTQVFRFLCDHVFPNTSQERVQMFTQYRIPINDPDEEDSTLKDVSDYQIYRANPSYGSASWQDWANVDWGNIDGTIPIHMLIFIQIDELKNGFVAGGTVVDKPGLYAISRMLKQSLTSEPIDSNDKNFLSHQDSVLVYWARKMLCSLSRRIRQKQDDYEAEQKLQDSIIGLVNVTAIVGPCIAVPYEIDGALDPHSYMFIVSRSTWPEVFTGMM
jgi:hypothetical protein